MRNSCRQILTTIDLKNYFCIIFDKKLEKYWPFLLQFYLSCWFYTLNHKKRNILFLTITLANLNRFL